MREDKVTTKVFKFNELEDSAQQKAIEWFLSEYPHQDWWDCTYEDAKTIGLEIEYFDLDRNRHAKGHFTEDGLTCAENIVKEHGEACETYKTAKSFIEDAAKLSETPDAEDYEDLKEEMEAEFLKSILEDYSIMLQKESEYLQSEEHAREMIEANEYEFTKDGKIY